MSMHFLLEDIRTTDMQLYYSIEQVLFQ
jgi:hypothetical protein